MTSDSLAVERLIVDLMRGAGSTRSAQLEAMSEEQWVKFEALARDYRCGPYLAESLSDIAPELARPALTRMRRNSVFRSLKIGKECIRIHEVLSEAGIKHLFLKGIPLAFRDYPEPWMRPMRDVDVLIEEGAIRRAYDLLVEEGGALEAFSQMPLAPTETGKHMPPIKSPNEVSLVELHYRVLSPKLVLDAGFREAFEHAIWEAPSSVDIGGTDIPVPSSEMLLIHMVIHGMLDHELNNGPLFITDVVHLLESGRIDPDRLVALIEQTGTKRAFELTAKMLPSSAREKLVFLDLDDLGVADDVFVALLLQPPEDRYQLKMMADVSAVSPREKVALIGKRVFPDKATIRSRWTLDHGSADNMPDNPLSLWLWFVTSRLAGLFKKRANVSGSARDSLLELRRSLAGDK